MANALNHCVICGKLKERHVAPGKVECWPRYYLRKTCGRLCGAALVLRVKHYAGTVSPRKCSFCQEPLRRRKDEQGRWAEDIVNFRSRIYCNQSCHRRARIAGALPGPPSVAVERSAKLREARRICDMTMCERCGTRSNIQVHHINRDWRDNEPSNLEALCVRCHVEEHRPDLLTKVPACAVDGCEKEHHALGYCLNHYASFSRYGNVHAQGNRLLRRPERPCTRCDQKAVKRGFCHRHYAQWHASPAFFRVQIHQKALSMSASEKPSIFRSVEMDAM